MYLDKLYNKLFSENNIDGINTLLKEIKLFSDPQNRASELVNIINLKKQKGQDYSAEMKELTQLQSQSKGGFDIGKAMGNVTNTLNNASGMVRTLNMIGSGLRDLGGLFIPK